MDNIPKVLQPRPIQNILPVITLPKVFDLPVPSAGYSPVFLDRSRKLLAIFLRASRASCRPPVLLSQLTKNSNSVLLCFDGLDSMWCRFTWWLWIKKIKVNKLYSFFLSFESKRWRLKKNTNLHCIIIMIINFNFLRYIVYGKECIYYYPWLQEHEEQWKCSPVL